MKSLSALTLNRLSTLENDLRRCRFFNHFTSYFRCGANCWGRL